MNHLIESHVEKEGMELEPVANDDGRNEDVFMEDCIYEAEGVEF